LKDQILGIEPNDDLALLRDRIMRTQGERILLHLAPAAALPRLDIALANRWAQQVGAQLIVVSGDSLTAREAHNAGVPWFASIDEALASPLPPPEHTAGLRKQASTALRQGPGLTSRDLEPHGARLLLATRIRGERAARHPGRAEFSPLLEKPVSNLLFAAPIVLLTVAAFLFLPQAKVIVTMPLDEEQLSLPIDAALVSEVFAEISVSHNVTSSGRVLVPITHALGELTLVNKGESLLAIPAGTRFRGPTPHRSSKRSMAVARPAGNWRGQGSRAPAQAAALRRARCAR
jgi:hypothetical protein